MENTKQQIFDFIIGHIRNNGADYSNWYVGIAEDARQRLFTDHNVSEELGFWAFIPASSSEDARIVEKYIIDNYKTKGDTGGGSDKTKYVYTYKIANYTVE